MVIDELHIEFLEGVVEGFVLDSIHGGNGFEGLYGVLL
jgi:hypothetical protein